MRLAVEPKDSKDGVNRLRDANVRQMQGDGVSKKTVKGDVESRIVKSKAASKGQTAPGVG